jgi:thiamine pyrophosphate-dependent acetolactate synthase large subunit-like protein
VTNTGLIHDNVRPARPGSWTNCGAGGLGWSGGAALGVKLAADAEGKKEFVCQIVGDGTYLFSVPGSVYWIARRYGIPVLTVVLNNNGEFLSDPLPCVPSTAPLDPALFDALVLRH